ncbi:MAG: transcription-repair coupling factor [Fimbriimonadaceae bacterium]|nr:transcription-repair coupling factor [Fimbriimonadaceae bacterium]
MRLADLARRLADAPHMAALRPEVEGPLFYTDCAREARPLLVAAAWLKNPERTLVLTPSHDRALHWQARLGLCGVPVDRIRILPGGLSTLFEDAAPETSALSDRIGALRQLAQPDPGFVIATPQAALERTLDLETLQTSFLEVEKGLEIDPEEIRRTLVRLGYEPAEPVRVPGRFSRRGGILDVFPMGGEQPIRIEFFGDEVDSLRTFNPMTQRSSGQVSRLVLAPSRETVMAEDPSHILGLIESGLDVEAAALGGEAGLRLREAVQGDMEALARGVFFDRLDLYRPYISPDGPSALDLLGDEGMLILDDPLELQIQAEKSEDELGQALAARAARGEILKASAHDFLAGIERAADAPRRRSFSILEVAPDWLTHASRESLQIRSLEGSRGQPVILTQNLKNWAEAGVAIYFGTDQQNRTTEMLKQVELFPAPPDPEAAIAPGLHLVEGNLAGGFIWEADGDRTSLALVTDHELFGVGRLKLPQRKFSEGIPVSSVLDLKEGDFVVHISFGIGVYRGLTTRVQDGVTREYLQIDYKEPDKLYVPADQLDRVQKYLSPGDEAPKINRLTGGEWQKTVGKAREEAREFARELIRLYAERKTVQRASFGPDTPWQQEMEHTFPWVETPSQLVAIDEVKRDMENDYPMDRLVCGDVGFGKTEVAIRAAFKAAIDRRQVAVLCPTTILSEQHFRNFQERLGSFDLKLALLNRFTHAAEKRRILDELADGKIDIILGTHALLNKSLVFRNLGLLIIDEEQKFGVKQKEALKELRMSVDVLSMSATPIPRTLSMALMGIREMSVINDPPPGRLPIRTFVRPFAREVVTEAVLRELARGGQVYYVTHQVQGIHHLAEQLRQMVPHARIAIGHGQMHEKELEPVMIGFIKGEIDILVSTTIVENGLDIANANTLIVESADRFGLSQLYQLRGRVGRSDRQAYAYFLFGSRKELTEGAGARLTALAEFSNLGSGYSLAVRDLQIRGAGDMLGAKQSGQMIAVGYDLYTQLIESEVEFLRRFADGERPRELSDPLAGLEPLPAADLPVAAHLPADYIAEQGQRLWYYKLLMGCRTAEDLSEVAKEIGDRYGMMPEEAANAVSIIDLRIRAAALQVSSMEFKAGRLTILFQREFEMSPRLLLLAQRRLKGAGWQERRLTWDTKQKPIAALHEAILTLEAAIREMEGDRASLAGRTP